MQLFISNLNIGTKVLKYTKPKGTTNIYLEIWITLSECKGGAEMKKINSKEIKV